MTRRERLGKPHKCWLVVAAFSVCQSVEKHGDRTCQSQYARHIAAGSAATHAPLQSATCCNGARPPMLCIGKMPELNYLINWFLS